MDNLLINTFRITTAFVSSLFFQHFILINNRPKDFLYKTNCKFYFSASSKPSVYLLNKNQSIIIIIMFMYILVKIISCQNCSFTTKQMRGWCEWVFYIEFPKSHFWVADCHDQCCPVLEQLNCIQQHNQMDVTHLQKNL